MVASLNNAVKQNSYISPVVLHWPPSMRVVNDQFFEFCQANKALRIERTVQGDCEIMAPTAGETGCLNAALTARLYIWAEREDSGVVFDSSSGFVLPNGAIRSPYVSWVKRTRLAVLTSEQKQRFLPLCPDFIIELRSPSDNLKAVQDKMQEYIENGARLGWLIDTEAQQVLVFQPQKQLFSLEKPEVLSADEVMKGFELDMQKIWNAEF